ncbi:MAG: iron ABC transporter permease [Oscillospiraceae bacterium]|nr:iron ABC transporter permease [Oscillospiraceae bacterium]
MLFILLGLAVIGTVLSLCVGAVSIAPGELLRVLSGENTTPSVRQILLYVRLPRTCGALLAGMALAVSGTLIQTVLANPLAAPNIIGVNAGAGLGVALCGALFPFATALVPLAAFCGALLGVLFVLAISERAGASRLTLVLSGVAVSSIFGAGIDLIVTLAPEALTGYSDFRIGGLGNLTLSRLVLPAGIILSELPLLMLLTNELDVLALGSETAQSLGLPARRLRILLHAAAAALAGAAVSFSGLLGFIGLLSPQIVRRLVGEESRFLLPGAALGGASLLLLSDVCARTLFAPFELPVGVVLSLLGGPFFLWLLFRQRGGRTHD